MVGFYFETSTSMYNYFTGMCNSWLYTAMNYTFQFTLKNRMTSTKSSFIEDRRSDTTNFNELNYLSTDTCETGDTASPSAVCLSEIFPQFYSSESQNFLWLIWNLIYAYLWRSRSRSRFTGTRVRLRPKSTDSGDSDSGFDSDSAALLETLVRSKQQRTKKGWESLR